jgi:hypothetical protein
LAAGQAVETENILLYRGKARIEYAGDELCHGQPCRKYRIGGPGMSNLDGLFWVNKAHGHFENVMHPLPDNADWNSFKFELQSVGSLSEGEWLDYVMQRRG